MVFAAGFGKRLLPLTYQIPKALICIDNIPLLKHIFNYYQSYCVAPFVINTHYLAAQLVDFIDKNPQYTICNSLEKNILGTGKGLFFAKKHLTSEHFWLHNTDILCNYDPQAMMDFHLAKNAIVTLAVCSQTLTSSRVKIAKNNEVLGFEKFDTPTNKNYELKTFCGIHCLSQKIFSLFTPEKIPTDIIELYKILLQKGEKIVAWDISSSNWIDVGTPKNLEFARKNKNLFLQ